MSPLSKHEIIPKNVTTTLPPAEGPQVGQWYMVKSGDNEEWFGCVIRVGSNYIKIKGPAGHSSWHEERIHLNEFFDTCKFVKDPEAYIKGKIEHHQRQVKVLLGEVSELTALLGVGPAPQITDGSGETQALAIRSDEPLNSYKKALVKAQDKTLPAIFEKIKEENGQLAGWMGAQLYPLEAEVEAMEKVTKKIKARIFSVELYAGLVEEVEQIVEGTPALLAEPVTLMQRMAYMDEECLADYQKGGMDIKNLNGFDKWIAKPANMKRLLPFPRCLIAFRVRREEKDRSDLSLGAIIGMIFSGELQMDKYTFLYIRNGEQLFRLRTGIEFGEKLFPDIDRQNLDGDLWAKKSHPGWELISNSEHLDLGEQWKEYEKKYKAAEAKKKGDGFWVRSPYDRMGDYHHFTHDSVYYDDILAHIKDLIDKHNRLVLVLQGLLDRSPIFHPHPPWKIWTGDGFQQAIRLIFDDSRALTSGEKPDFEAYRTRLNSSIKAGTVTVGQEEAWERKEAEKYNAQMHANWRVRDHRDVRHHRPYGNPGPGTLARCTHGSRKHVQYAWKRERQGYQHYGNSGPITSHFRTETANVLNVDAYKPGDFHQFYDDPRTRAEYLEWAPLLIEAEEYHAGNRKVGPNEDE